jgi:hypothetical protein
LPPFLQREALKYTVEQRFYDRDEEAQLSQIEQVPFLAISLR